VRILIIDDSRAMRAFVRVALEAEEPLLITEAPSGVEALRILPRERFDLVITDLNMPGINGLEVVAFMRRLEAHRMTPLLIITTEAAPRDRERALGLGADAYLTKPFDADALREAVRVARARATGVAGG
jgi:two-component system chemotaxis response regulator CheY